MAAKRKTKIEEVTSVNTEEPEIKALVDAEEATVEVKEQNIIDEEPKTIEVKKVNEPKSKTVEIKKVEKTPKYPIGSIVFVSKDADADLNGFKLFPQYKKYTYTVEAYDANTDVFTLRRLNLSLRLKEADIVAPSERAHDTLNRRQF